MVRVLIGSVVAGIAMFVVGFLFWATPLAGIGYSGVDEAPGAAVQQALATNLPHTGRYIVPAPDTAGGTVLYGRGPVATVDYNSAGYPASDPVALVGGLVKEIAVALMIGLALRIVAARVTDTPSRLRVALGISAAAAVMVQLGDPIYNHADWRYALYALIADLAMLAAASVVIVRWFLPVPAAARPAETAQPGASI